jgi:hypothetical protein
LHDIEHNSYVPASGFQKILFSLLLTIAAADRERVGKALLKPNGDLRASL